MPLNGRNAVHGRVSRPDDLTPAAPHALLRAAKKGFAADMSNPTHDLEEKTEGIDVTDANLDKGSRMLRGWVRHNHP